MSPPHQDAAGPSPERLARALDAAAARLEAMQHARTEPIAVIGLGCRFPGAAAGPDAYWRLLCDGRDATMEVPAARWDLDAWFDPDPDAAGKMYVRRGGFLAEVAGFDARFFEIAPREAASMDPQQRLVLEVAWEALEHAGVAPAGLSGSATGVFVGATTTDYGGLLLRQGAAVLDAYFSTGNALNAIPGRLAHLLGLQGPCLAVDTACSSSLVAVHLACQSLRGGECDLALAGGVNLMLAPDITATLCRARMLAPDGRCKTFDAAADGYGRGEGCGVAVLRRLSDALAAGDRVLALIRGSAVNQDGASSGFTVPNGRAQEALIRKALEGARVEPATIDYLEAHGTGTSLGDPIEVRAAAAALGAGRAPQHPLLLGSVKANIGHTEAAAGIAGLIKTVLALQAGFIPPQPHFHTPNPRIPWDELPVAVAAPGRPWPRGGPLRRAAVSAFGASGTNAHAILEEAPPTAPPAANVPERPLHLLALSARTEPALRCLAAAYAGHLEAHPDDSWADVCHGANTGRSHHGVRACVVAADAAQAQSGLRALAAHAPLAPPVGQAPRVAFLFSGQGSQYPGMARRLYATQPGFRRALDDCADLLRESLDRPLSALLFDPDPALLADTRYTQPALFALQYALAQLWQSWGIRPAAVMGHSVGEYAAACVAGVFDLAQGLRLVARRGALMAQLPADGAMAAVAAAADLVQTAITPYAGELAVAAINAPDQTVIAGRRRVLEAVLADLARQGIASSPLRVSHAFHSPLLEPMLAPLERAAGEVRLQPPRLPLVSNLSGEPAGEEVATAAYWARHARQPVRFADGMAALRRRGCEVFVEIGPARTLLGLGRRCLPDAGLLWLPSLQPDRGDWEPLLASLARLYERGLDPDWRGFDRDYRRARPALPTYPWQRESHWLPAAGRPPAPPAAPAELPDPDLVYEIVWHRADAAAAPGPADYWPPPAALAQRLRPVLAECAPPDADAAYVAALDALEALGVDYAAQAWERLGWDFAAGTCCPGAELAGRLGVVPRYRPLLERTAQMLTEAGLLRRRGDDWESAAEWASRGPGERIAALCAQCPAAQAELILLERCGGQLAEVLTGRADPLPLLFPAPESIGAASLYGATPGARFMNRVVAQAVALALAALPAGRRLRVLELGAGTGATTAGLLDLLPADRTDYLFTDLSPHFIAAARERFARFPFMHYRLLDLERDPAEQGYGDEPPGDLIIAANVLHATRDLHRTLRHVRALAAPGALLVLLEGTAPSRAVDLIFGLTEGWWRFAGDPLRPHHPLLSVAHWQSALEASDFGRGAALALPARPWGLLARQAVILACATGAGAPPPCWLVLADRDGIGTGLASRHVDQGGEALLAYPGAGFERVGDHALRVAPDCPDALGRLLAQLPPGRRCEVIHLWSLDEPAMDAAPEPGSGRLSCASVLCLVQALAAAERRPVPRLWLVTRGAVGGQDGAPLPGLSQAPLWGLGRTIAHEHPELRAMRVDLDPAAAPAVGTAALAAELAAPAAEDEAAWRAGVRRVPRLARYPGAAPGGPLTFRGDAAYLIVGGLGGLGLLTARWMAERGARHLALVGRHAPGPDAQAALRALAAQGVAVLVRQADVADYPAMQRLWSELAERLPPLRGIVHAAGVLDDGLLRHLSLERFERVLRPKVAGAWNLHRLSAQLGLDWFVLYASFTGVLGTPGQANHAAANAFLDALAWHRRGLGLPALSLDWGAWSDIGAAAARGTDRRVEAKGGAALSPAQGLRQLEATWRAAPAQLAVVPIHWDRMAEAFAARALFADLRVPGCARPAAGAPALRTRLDSTAPPRRRALLLAQVLAETARVLGLRETETLDPRQGFFALGMDSLTAMELRNRLRTGLGCELPSTAAFDYPNPEALTDFLLARLAPPPPPTAPTAPDRDRADLGQFSAAQLDQLIDQLTETPR